jgi:hypothetical protein
VILKSPGEPQDLTSFVRWTQWRFRRYEDIIGLNIRPAADESEQETRERQARIIKNAFRRQSDTMWAYMNWQWRRFHEAHPDCPLPVQVILVNRCYGIGPPQEQGKLSGPYAQPIARWLPQAPRPQGGRPVEVYDPVRKRFD